MTDVCWVESAERYDRRAESLVADGVLPVLVPDQDRRRRRWEQVLAWHLGAASGVPRVWPTAPDGAADVVAALDTDARPAARVLAAATGRRVVLLADDDQVEHMVGGPVRSVVFLGMPTSLTVRRVHQLNQTMRCPWGVLTAIDPSGLSFVVAKLLAARDRPDQPRALIDIRESRMSETDPGGQWSPFSPLDHDRVAHWLFDREWDALGLDAHGEGAHVNLGQVVGCGLVDGNEVEVGGGALAGCADASPPVCKRVTSDDQRVLPLRDLRTRELFLVSCNGFAVAGDMYPSSLSCVLSAADGYPARLLTTDRLTAVDHWAAPLLMRVAERMSAGRVHQFANDLSLRLTGTRPWVLFGDPAGADEELPVIQADGVLAAAPEARSVVPFRHSGRSRLVLDLAGGGEGRVVLGERQGALMLPAPASGPWRLADRAGELARLTTRMRTLGRLVRRAGSLEHAARRLIDARHVEHAADALAVVRDARLRLEYVAQTGLRECTDALRRGVWNPVLIRQAEAVSLCVAAWDRAFAALLAGHLFEGVEQVFADGWPVRTRSTGDPCPRCATLTSVTVLGHPLGERPDTWLVTCPVCGPSTAYRAGGPRVQVEVPGRFVAGERATVLVTTTDPRQEPLVDNGFLGCDLVDKGWGTSFHRTAVPLGATTHELEVDVPSNLRADLHTVRVVWVRGLEAASCRVRVPGMARYPVNVSVQSGWRERSGAQV